MRADVVVVGAGAAGSVVARRLAETGADVLLLEAGRDRASERAGVLDVGPASTVITRHHASLGDSVIELPRGRTLGGSGAVNGGYCVPARPSDVARWGPDWPRRYEVGLARAAERLRPRLVPMSAAAARLAAAFPGRVSAVPQAREGVRRVTAFHAWDPSGAGVRVRTGAQVRQLVWAGGLVGGRCEGVVLDDDEEVSAREVILCAGSIGTAAVLLASGLGTSTGHPVGRGVQEHPELLLDLPADDADGPEVLTSAPPRLTPLLTHVVRLGQGNGTPEVEVRPYSVPLHRAIPGLAPQPLRIGLSLMNPRGRGAIVPIRHAGGDAAAAEVRVELPEDADDRSALTDAAAVVARRLGLVAPGAAPSMVWTTSHHLTGSARIGEVVDGAGRVLDVDGLRVADASVLPSLPRCGPYYSVLAVAEDLAARAAAGWA